MVGARAWTGPNLAEAALDALREPRRRQLPPLECASRSGSRSPPGSAAAAPTPPPSLRAANRIVGAPLDAAELRALAAGLGSDVPSQVEPAPRARAGAGRASSSRSSCRRSRRAGPAARRAVHRRRLRRARPPRRLAAPARPRRAALASRAPMRAARRCSENDLEPAALSLRPELHDAPRALGPPARSARRQRVGPHLLRPVRGPTAPPRRPRPRSPARSPPRCAR